FDYNRKKKWKLKALAATSIAGGFLVFLYEKNWLEAIMQRMSLQKQRHSFYNYKILEVLYTWSKKSKVSFYRFAIDTKLTLSGR
ncbi:hypothetical protein Q7V25_06245, partial [Streptococcus suis]|nr:hypothetical protein [Streptococcus suis]MDW8607710.1 hypothetical protein [Streptococcus suis]MDW8617421.1 hypothetical protein [Streptococcus suis]